jgi:hypothetical protein
MKIHQITIAIFVRHHLMKNPMKAKKSNLKTYMKARMDSWEFRLELQYLIISLTKISCGVFSQERSWTAEIFQVGMKSRKGLGMETMSLNREEQEMDSALKQKIGSIFRLCRMGH